MADFSAPLARYDLSPDGAPIHTHAADLLPVRTAEGRAAMLKIARSGEERRGAALLEWWAGDGAVEVLAREGDLLVMVRAEGPRRLDAMAREGADDEACRILCEAAVGLHQARVGTPPPLEPLADRFAALWPVARDDARFAPAAEAARRLLDAPQQVAVLHGDIHHGNVLDFGTGGWRAIDPKGLRGERGFDFANIFTNPDLGDPSCGIATDPARFAARLGIVCAVAGLEPARMCDWVIAWTGLSAAWSLEDGGAGVDLCLGVGGLARRCRDDGK